MFIYHPLKHDFTFRLNNYSKLISLVYFMNVYFIEATVWDIAENVIVKNLLNCPTLKRKSLIFVFVVIMWM